MHDDEIIGSHDAKDLGELSAQRLVIVSALRLAQWSTVAQVSVQTIVEPLRDLEEAGVRFVHEPMDFDAVSREVPEGRAEELGDTAAFGRRVDVPHPASAQVHPGVADHGVVAFAGLGAAMVRRRSAGRIETGTSNICST